MSQPVEGVDSTVRTEPPRELSVHSGISIAADEVENRASGAARGGFGSSGGGGAVVRGEALGRGGGVEDYIWAGGVGSLEGRGGHPMVRGG